MHRFTGEDTQTYRAEEVMALMYETHQRAKRIMRLTAYRLFSAGCLVGAGVILLIQRFT